jgi:hypothetical protein
MPSSKLDDLEESRAFPNPYDALQRRIRTNWDTGQLRAEASLKMEESAAENNYAGFPSIPLDRFHHTVIRSKKDNSIIAYHVPRAWLEVNGAPSEYVQTLVCLVENLPNKRSGGPNKNGMERRGLQDTRTYQFWVGCVQSGEEPNERGLNGSMGHSKDYIDDGDKGQELKNHCAHLCQVLGRVHRRVFPGEGGVLERCESREEFLAPPWPGMSINRGHVDAPVETKPHKDTGNAFYSMSCLYACGNFTAGDVVLVEAKVTLPVESGDALFVASNLITHANKKAFGVRHSLVMYAKKETMTHVMSSKDWKMDLKRKARKKKREQKRQ